MLVNLFYIFNMILTRRTHYDVYNILSKSGLTAPNLYDQTTIALE